MTRRAGPAARGRLGGMVTLAGGTQPRTHRAQHRRAREHGERDQADDPVPPEPHGSSIAGPRSPDESV